MGNFTTRQIQLTQEQKKKLIEHSNTYWKKYDVRLVQVYYKEIPVDSFIVQYKVFVDTEQPEFEGFSWSAPKSTMEKIIGTIS